MAYKALNESGDEILAKNCTVDDLNTIFYCAGEVNGIKCKIPMNLRALKSSNESSREISPYFAPAKKSVKHIHDCPCETDSSSVLDDKYLDPYKLFEKLQRPVQKGSHGEKTKESDNETNDIHISTFNKYYVYCKSHSPENLIWEDKKISDFISDNRNLEKRKYGIWGLQIVEGKYVADYLAKNGLHCIKLYYPFDETESYKNYSCYAYFENANQFAIVKKKLSKTSKSNVCICILAQWKTGTDGNSSYAYLNSSSQVLLPRK